MFILMSIFILIPTILYCFSPSLYFMSLSIIFVFFQFIFSDDFAKKYKINISADMERESRIGITELTFSSLIVQFLIKMTSIALGNKMQIVARIVVKIFSNAIIPYSTAKIILKGFIPFILWLLILFIIRPVLKKIETIIAKKLDINNKHNQNKKKQEAVSYEQTTKQ